jgi:uncharacterized protein (DUF433 family)
MWHSRPSSVARVSNPWTWGIKSRNGIVCGKTQPLRANNPPISPSAPASSERNRTAPEATWGEGELQAIFIRNYPYNRAVADQLPTHIDPHIQGGTPCFTGTRVPVRSLYDAIQHRRSIAISYNNFLRLLENRLKHSWTRRNQRADFRIPCPCETSPAPPL